jgi:hypothetical protein
VLVILIMVFVKQFFFGFVESISGFSVILYAYHHIFGGKMHVSFDGIQLYIPTIYFDRMQLCIPTISFNWIQLCMLAI